MKACPCCQSPSNFGGSAGLRSDLNLVLGRGTGVIGCAKTAQERSVKVSVIDFKVCDIFSWFSVSFASRSASCFSVWKAEVTGRRQKSLEAER